MTRYDLACHLYDAGAPEPVTFAMLVTGFIITSEASRVFDPFAVMRFSECQSEYRDAKCKVSCIEKALREFGEIAIDERETSY